MQDWGLPENAQARLARLLEIEAIRDLKLRYAQYLDSLLIDHLADLFTEDAVCHFGPYGEWSGRTAIRQNYHDVMAQTVKAAFGSMHHICNHRVELTGDGNAVGRSYLIDVLTERRPDENPVLLYGLYDERYRKVDGDWKISFSRIHFLWPQREVDDALLSRPVGR
jgi:ketosteroid isomerase-like protein